MEARYPTTTACYITLTNHLLRSMYCMTYLSCCPTLSLCFTTLILFSYSSIFRRPYFLSRFLPALLTPRVVSLMLSCFRWNAFDWMVCLRGLSRFCILCLCPFQLPVKPDARMNFIDSLKKYFWHSHSAIQPLTTQFSVCLRLIQMFFVYWFQFCFLLSTRAEKIPAAQHSSYIESCQRERQRQQDSVYHHMFNTLRILI